MSYFPRRKQVGMKNSYNNTYNNMDQRLGTMPNSGSMIDQDLDSYVGDPPLKKSRNDSNDGRPPAALLNEKFTGLEYQFTETKVGAWPYFNAKVELNGETFEGSGKSKKIAKNEAAQKILEAYHIIEASGNGGQSQSSVVAQAMDRTEKLNIESSSSFVPTVNVDPTMHSDVNAIKTAARQCNYGPVMLLLKLRPSTQFLLVHESGEPPHKKFIFSVTVDERTFKATANNKKTAKAAAASLALDKVLGVTIESPSLSRLLTNTSNNDMEATSSQPQVQPQVQSQPQLQPQPQSQPQAQSHPQPQIQSQPQNQQPQPQHQSNKQKRNTSWNKRYDPILQRLQEIEGASTYELPPSCIDHSKKFLNSCRLWVGNLSKSFTEPYLKELFGQFGECENVYFDTEKSFGFVTMDYRGNADRAKQTLHNTRVLNSNIIVRFSAPGTALKLRNLSPYVTNELLEYSFSVFGELEKAVVICDDKGRPMGEGIVEFAKKSCATNALKRCSEELFFITFSPRPVIAEMLTISYDGEGIKEMDLRKNSPEYNKERLLGPRFAAPGSFEESYGRKWRQIYEIYDMKKTMLEKELLLEEKQLLDDIEVSQYEYETNMLREQVRQREEALTFTSRFAEPNGRQTNNFSTANNW